MNTLKRDYEFEKSLECEYEEAKRNGDEAAIEIIRKKHELFESDLKNAGNTYCMMYSLYSDTKNRGNELIDVSEPHQYNDAEKLITAFRHYGIEKFVFTSGWSSATETAWIFTKLGCKLEGLVEINGRTKAFMSDKLEKVHGFLFSVN